MPLTNDRKRYAFQVFMPVATTNTMREGILIIPALLTQELIKRIRSIKKMLGLKVYSEKIHFCNAHSPYSTYTRNFFKDQ